MELQRKFGLCLLRLQRYEHLAKAIVAGSVIEGDGKTVVSRSKTKVGPISNMTLGLLVNEITGALVKSDAEPDGSDSPITGDPTQVRFRATFGQELPAEEHAKFKMRLEGFVNSRNELAHHFLQKFDVSSDSGCKDAIAHLDQCLASVDAELLELKNLASNMREMMMMQAQVLGQIDIMKVFAREFPGNSPDDFGPEHELIRWLKQAECLAREDGWTSLTAAGHYIQTQAPGLRLKDHRVAKWSKVLDRSRVFEKRVEFSPGNPWPTRWYRSHLAK
jgi:hypothetical protein